MTLNNSMSITPSPPGKAKGVRFQHGSVLGGKTRAAWVSSQWKSTGSHIKASVTRESTIKFGKVISCEQKYNPATQVVRVEYIGKESNRWEEQYYLGLDDGADIAYGSNPSAPSGHLPELKLLVDEF